MIKKWYNNFISWVDAEDMRSDIILIQDISSIERKFLVIIIITCIVTILTQP